MFVKGVLVLLLICNFIIFVCNYFEACLIRVDQRTGNVYWVSCDGLSIGATHVILPDQSVSQQLYQAREEISGLFMDWNQGQFYWLEDGQLIRMKLGLLGGSAREIFSFSKDIVSRIVFDWKGNSFLWKSQNGLSFIYFFPF